MLIQFWKMLLVFFPSASEVEGIKSVPSVCMYVSVRLSVSEHSNNRTVWPRIMKFDVSQLVCHRSKVKVKVIFLCFWIKFDPHNANSTRCHAVM